MEGTTASDRATMRKARGNAVKIRCSEYVLVLNEEFHFGTDVALVFIGTERDVGSGPFVEYRSVAPCLAWLIEVVTLLSSCTARAGSSSSSSTNAVDV